MSHDIVVSRAFEGSFQKKREGRNGREEGRCRTVGGLEKKKDVVGQFCNLGLCGSGL